MRGGSVQKECKQQNDLQQVEYQGFWLNMIQGKVVMKITHVSDPSLCYKCRLTNWALGRIVKTICLAASTEGSPHRRWMTRQSDSTFSRGRWGRSSTVWLSSVCRTKTCGAQLQEQTWWYGIIFSISEEECKQAARLSSHLHQPVQTWIKWLSSGLPVDQPTSQGSRSP